MGFDGTEGSAITLPAASALTQEHRHVNPGARLGHFFGKKILQDLLDQEGCVGIRIYYGIDCETGKRELVLVGADEEEDDMLELVVDFSKACPNRCSSANVLNS